MNKFDKKIVKLAKQAHCPTDRVYDERIEELLKSLEHKPDTASQKGISFSKIMIAACSFAAALLVSIPASARISSYVKERMSRISEQELENYIDAADQENMTKQHSIEALTYSRELSAEEQIRYDALFEKYENEGLFPENDLPIIDQAEESAEIEYPFYETCNFEYYLPDRALTDEELLELIDFSHKLDYATSHNEAAQNIIQAQQEFFAHPNPGENDLSEDEAVKIAASYLDKLSDKDCSSMETSVEFCFGYCEIDGEYGDYMVTFKANDEESYIVCISRKKGSLTYAYYILNGVNYAAYNGTSAPVDEPLFHARYESAKAKLTQILDPDISITESSYEYYTDENGDVEYGYVYYIFKLSNGYVYSMGYNIQDDIFPRLHLVTTDGSYQALYDAVVVPMEP